MKKTLLLLATVLMSVSSFAQWTKPTLGIPTPKAQEMKLDDGETDGLYQYLFNVEAGGFFRGANDYMTRASVCDTMGYKVKITEESEGYYSLTDSVLKFSEWRKTFVAGVAAIWVDNNSGAGCNDWTLTALGENKYQIGNHYQDENEAYPYDGLLLGAKLDKYPTVDSRLYMEAASSNFGTTWICVSEEDYQTYIAAAKAAYPEYLSNLEIYFAADSLKSSIDETKAEYADIDLSSVEAVYNNTSSSLQELRDARTSIKTIIYNYLIGGLSKATVDEPVDATGFLTNPSFEEGNLNGWTCPKANPNGLGDSSDVGVYANSNGTYHFDNADGNYVFNVWAWGNPLTQTVSGLPAGIYELSAIVTSSDDCTNVYITAEAGFGEQYKAVTLEASATGSKQTYGTRGSFVFASDGSDMTVGAVGCDADGVSYLKGGRWWYKADGFTLKYLGSSDASYVYWRDNNPMTGIEEDTPGHKQLLSDYANAISAYNTATSASEIIAAYQAVANLSDSVKANVAAYKTLYNKIDTWDKACAEHTSLAGEYWDAFTDFINSEEEVEGYPTPTPSVIKSGEWTLSTPEVTSYINKVDSLYAYAVAHSLSEGADCTDMIVNANWSETNPKGKGWTEVSGKCTNNNLSDGMTAFPVAESYHSVFDFQQVIEDVPDGIYSVSLNGFCRIDGTDTEVPAYIYMNDFSTRLQNIAEDALNPENAQDGINCYLTENSWKANPIFADHVGTPAGNTLYDQTTINENGWYTPNGMAGASIAFSAGRYEAKTYGLVSGGKMTIGVRNLTSTTVWALWSNFKLTYEGKSAEALAEILPTYTNELSQYFEENADNMTTPMTSQIENVLTEAEDAVESGDGDQMYTALEDVNSALTAAKANVAAFTAFETTLEDAATLYESSDNESAKAEYDALSAEVADFSDFTTEQLTSYVEKINAVIKDLKIPGAIASDDNPVDYTALIENADIEQGATVAWQYTKNGGNGPDLASGISGASIEFWNESASSLKFNIYQTITLPAGKYELKADASNSLNGQSAGTGTGHAALYATVVNSNETVSEAVVVQTEGCTEKYNNYSVIFTVPEGGSDVTIGFQTVGTMSARWFVCDNFTLSAYGTSSAKEDTGDKGEVPVESIESNSVSTSAIYSVAGARNNKLQKGVNIVKMADGTVKKIYVK